MLPAVYQPLPPLLLLWLLLAPRYMSHLKHEEGMRHGTNSTSTNMINNYLDVPLSATNEGTKVGCSKWSDKNWGIKVKIPSLGDERVGL